VTDWKSDVTEIAKLGTAIGIDVAFQKSPDIPWLSSPFGPVINDILVAILSAALVVLGTNLIFERPKLVVVWKRSRDVERGPSIRFQPIPTTAKEYFSVTCTTEGGRSCFGWYLRRNQFYDKLSLQISPLPPDALVVNPDTGQHAVAGVIVGGGIRLRLDQMPHGATSVAGFFLELGVGIVGARDVTLQHAFLRDAQQGKWFDQHALRRDIRVDVVEAIRT
jgi:hypothetical protein